MRLKKQLILQEVSSQRALKKCLMICDPLYPHMKCIIDLFSIKLAGLKEVAPLVLRRH